MSFFSKTLLVFVLIVINHCYAAVSLTLLLPTKRVDLRDPKTISISPDGLIYIADTGHNRVICIDSTGELVAETGGYGEGHGQFRRPEDIKANQGNSVWVLDYGNQRLEKFSRTLEYQGTFKPMESSETAAEPKKFSMSQQGDIFIFDQNENRILAYDPLFKLRSTHGGNQKIEFVNEIVSMEYVSGLGLFWTEKNSGFLNNSDNIFSSLRRFKLSDEQSNTHFAVSDSSVVFSSMLSLNSVTLFSSDLPQSLCSKADLAEAGITEITAIAYDRKIGILILDGKQGRLYRCLVNKK